jgi:hypothetical protein
MIILMSEFPLVKIEELTDEEFAIMSNNAEWLFRKKQEIQMAALTGMGMGGGKGKKTGRPAPPRRR